MKKLFSLLLVMLVFVTVNFAESPSVNHDGKQNIVGEMIDISSSLIPEGVTITELNKVDNPLQISSSEVWDIVGNTENTEVLVLQMDFGSVLSFGLITKTKTLRSKFNRIDCNIWGLSEMC